MIADPLWSCVMLLCGPLWVFLWSFAVFSHTPSGLSPKRPRILADVIIVQAHTNCAISVININYTYSIPINGSKP